MLTEIISAIVILGIAILFLNPGHLAMPESLQSMLIIGFFVAFLTFAAFILKERALDERESLHTLKAGRISYLAGVGVLVLGIILETFKHDVDPWLVIGVCIMVLSKILSRIYSQFKM